MNYPVADCLIRIKNGYMAHQRMVELPYSKFIEAMANVLVKEGYLKSVKKTSEGNKHSLTAELLYTGRKPTLTDVSIISKPSVHKYMTKNEVKKTLREYGISVISTSSGVMSNKMAAEKNLGGEIVCKIS